MAIQPSKTYSAKDYAIIIGGALLVGEESVTISLPNAQWSPNHGAKGELEMAENSAHKYTEITANMMQTSIGQATLGAVQLTGAYVAVTIADTQGSDFFMASQMKVELPNTNTYAKDAGTTRPWMLKGNYDTYTPFGKVV